MVRQENQEDQLHSMSLGDHLEELRARLILALTGFAVALVLSFFIGHRFVQALMIPFENAIKQAGLNTSHIQAITVAEPFMVYIKAVVVLAMLISSPWLFYQLWSFISAGLYKKEKRFVYKVVPFSAGLFITGTLFFIFVIAPMTMKFFITFNLGIEYLEYNPHIGDYVNLILMLSLIFGLAFQMPIIIIFAESLGLISLKTLKENRKYVLLGVFVVAAMVTPSADMITQTALAIPLYILYEGSLFYCSMKRKGAKQPEVVFPEPEKQS
ncbi:MAG TPA: twin-arginine translocase subunit TatC [Anaerohalosphaeraceae bacterium]|nr:twin-arginine translocase subunit TatC [Anaerohalosphaeraceae bacterium]